MNIENIKKIHDSLRRELMNALDSSGDYSYPETADGLYVSGCFTEEPDLDVLYKICEYTCSKGTTRYDGQWDHKWLFQFLEKKIVLPKNGKRYSIILYFGGLSPVLSLLPFLSECSSIDSLDVSFTHDKWEARGDYQAETRVGLKLRNQRIVVEEFYMDDVSFEPCDPTPYNMTLDENYVLIRYSEIEEDCGELVLPDHARGISRDALVALKKTKKITLNASCKFSEGMFEGINCLEELDFSKSYREIIPASFCENCRSLTKVVFSDRIYKISDGAFKNCSSLSNINIPKAILCVGKDSFSNCNALSGKLRKKLEELANDPGKFDRLVDESISYIQSHGSTSYSFGRGVDQSYRWLFATRSYYERWHEMYDKYFDTCHRLSKGKFRFAIWTDVEKMQKLQDEYAVQLTELAWKQTKDVSQATDYLVVDTNDIPNFDRFISKQQRIDLGDFQGASVFGNNLLEKAVKIKDDGGKIKILTLEAFSLMLSDCDFDEGNDEIKLKNEAEKVQCEAKRTAKKENKESQCEDLIASIIAKSKEQGRLFTNSEIVSMVEDSDVPLRRLEKYISDKNGKTLKEFFEDSGVLKTVKTEFFAMVETLKKRYKNKVKENDVTALISHNSDLDLSVIANNSKRFTGLSTREFLLSEGILAGAEIKRTESLTEGVIYKPGKEPADIKKRIDTLFEKLDSAYPDKVIIGLHKDHKKWGETVTDLYRKLGYKSGADFLSAYGYKMSDDNGGRPKADHTSTIDELKRRYPNGASFKTVDELFVANPDIAGQLNTLKKDASQVLGMTFAKWLKSIGLMANKKR